MVAVGLGESRPSPGPALPRRGAGRRLGPESRVARPACAGASPHAGPVARAPRPDGLCSGALRRPGLACGRSTGKAVGWGQLSPMRRGGRALGVGVSDRCFPPVRGGAPACRAGGCLWPAGGQEGSYARVSREWPFWFVYFRLWFYCYCFGFFHKERCASPSQSVP